MNETEARDYLLGRLSETEREAIEASALQHDEAYETIRAVEADLFDEFALTSLPPADRHAFVERYGRQKSRIAFAAALSERTGNVVAFPAQTWIGLAAAAAIVVVVGSVLIRGVVDVPASAPLSSTRPHAVVTRPTVAVPPPMLVAITLGGSRGAQPSPVISIPSDVETVRFRIGLNPQDRFDHYSLALPPVWRVDGLKAATDNGDLVVFADIPANVLENGRYELAVQGNGEDLGFVTVEVRHSE